MERRLAAILSADVVGYSRLMGDDEAGTLAALKTHRAELIDPKAAQYNGRTIKLMGDGALMEFPSVVEAVTFAVEVQLAMRERNRAVPEYRQILYRIGINIGDIIVEGDDIYGDGVNIAARLENLAEPGGICVRRNVRNQVRDKLDLDFADRGEIEVKNIARPVRVFVVKLDQKAEALVTPVAAMTAATVRQRWPTIVAGAALSLAAVFGLVWWHPWSPAVEPAAIEQETLPIPEAESIAVLPFENMSGNSELEYFSDGVTEDIITELSKNPYLKVVSRNSSFTYKGQAVKARQVGEELGVNYLLEGSVRKQKDKVRITAQLIDAKADTHVWAERFDEEDADPFALQDRIVEKIDAALSGGQGKIRLAEYKRVWKKDATELEEYDYYLRGHAIYYRFTPEDILKAREIWQEGLGKFPGSGLLRIKIGWTHFQFFWRGWSNEPDADLARAYELAQEGLSDENLGPAGQWNGHWLNAFVQLYFKGDHDRALQEAITTVDIVPNDSETLALSAAIAVYAGEPDLALEWSIRAVSREAQVPDWYYIDLGRAYQLKGDCEQAVKELKRIPWSSIDGGTSLAACYVELGQLDDARTALAKVLEERPNLTANNLRRELPFRDDEFFDQFRSALEQVGLPE